MFPFSGTPSSPFSRNRLLTLEQAHSDCSEGFYKNELEADIRTNPSQSNEERRRMMELLKRFEEEAAEDEDALLHSEEDEDDLAQRLGTLDLGRS